MGQDNNLKTPTEVGVVENAAGNESGVSTTAGLGAVAKSFASPTGNDGPNATASTENLSAKWKGGAQDVPEAGKDQYC